MEDLYAEVKRISDRGDYLHAEDLLSKVQSKLVVTSKKRKMMKACMQVVKITKSRYFDCIL